jgi:hypothetical protein
MLFARLAVFSAMNLVYQVLRKPTEVFAPVSGAFNKTPIETWRQFAPLFREYSTASISPELLAALAQVEGREKGTLGLSTSANLATRGRTTLTEINLMGRNGHRR